MSSTKKLVEEELPLKQGLKPSIWQGNMKLIACVEEELPLKQGLKHRLQEIDFVADVELKRNFH